jgi:GDPmannose 4,6-dehydratase
MAPIWPSCCLSKGYVVHGTFRRTSSVNFWRIEELGIQDNPDLVLSSTT